MRRTRTRGGNEGNEERRGVGQQAEDESEEVEERKMAVEGTREIAVVGKREKATPDDREMPAAGETESAMAGESGKATAEEGEIKTTDSMARQKGRKPHDFTV